MSEQLTFDFNAPTQPHPTPEAFMFEILTADRQRVEAPAFYQSSGLVVHNSINSKRIVCPDLYTVSHRTGTRIIGPFDDLDSAIACCDYLVNQLEAIGEKWTSIGLDSLMKQTHPQFREVLKIRNDAIEIFMSGNEENAAKQEARSR